MATGHSLTIGVRGQFDIARAWSHLEPAELAKRAAIALNNTAGQARSEVRIEMTSVFDRPTPFALNALRLEPARQNDLRAELTFRAGLGKSLTRTAAEFLGPQIGGGQRVDKRFEAALRRIGLLPQGREVVPGAAIARDAYGNVPASEIVRIMSYLQAFGEQGYRSNTTAEGRAKLAKGTKKKYGYELFVVPVNPTNRGKRLHAGVWRRTFTGFGSAIGPLLMFVPKVSYRPRLAFPQIVERVVKRDLDRNFSDAFARATPAPGSATR